jgi:hypothetical protein
LKSKLFLLTALFVVLGLLLIIQIKAADFSWKDDFSYANLQQMQDAGWVLENPSGTRLESGGVVIDGTKADTVIRYRDFPSGIYDWSVETRSMWLGVGHSGPGINVITEKHNYGVVADGWYNHFAFARDDKQVTFGSYTEQANVWVTMTITKKGNAVNVYCNGVSIYNYTEADTASYKLTGVDRIAPWRGVMLYDYYQVAGPDAVSVPTADSGGFPIFYVAVGGGIAAIVAIGAVVYFQFFAGGSAAAAAGAASGAAAGTPPEPSVSPEPTKAPASGEEGTDMEFDSGAQGAEDTGGTDQSSKEQSSVYDDPEAASPDVEWSGTSEE